MRDATGFWDARRQTPRVGVAALCNEILDRRERPVLAVDLSEWGVRIERPYVGGPLPRELQLELELPEVDEIVWARGIVCFDEVRPPTASSGGRLQRATGVRLDGVASRQRRLLRDFVTESYRARADDELFTPIWPQRARDSDPLATLLASW